MSFPWPLKPPLANPSAPFGFRPSDLFRISAFGFLIFLLLLAGCAVGPNYHRPPLDVPANFRGAETRSTNSLATLPWRELFQDPTLQEFIGVALTNNYDLRIAFSRVEQARAVAAQNRALFFPQLNYGGNIGRGKNAIGSNLFSTGGQTISSIGVAGNASWEIDLFGRIRRLNESARAQFLATDEARRDITLTVISDVAQAYFELLALDQTLEIAKRSTNSFGQSYTIFSERLQQGVASTLETAAAQALRDSAAATVPNLQRQILLQENQLNVLLGRNPASVPRNHTLLQEVLPPAIPAGLPSALLERRPDIRQAEQNLRSANAQVGVAVADFFPRLNLTALAGQISPELSAFTAGGANAWSLAAGLTGPLFQGGRLRAQYRQALAAREEARLRYQATVLNAFQEVSSSLISVRLLAEARQQQAQAVQAYQVAVQTSLERYVAGHASYYEVLQEQQQLFPAENSLVQIQLNQYLAMVQLYRALGGGFASQ
jgi:outer membrane protein, multidrug efflux system